MSKEPVEKDAVSEQPFVFYANWTGDEPVMIEDTAPGGDPPTYTLTMNGINDYIQTPVLRFDEVRFEFAAEPNEGVYSAYIDASSGIGNAAFIRNSAGQDYWDKAWQSVLIDGVDRTDANGKATIVPNQQRTHAILRLKTAGSSSICFFANQLGNIPMKGKIYQIQILLEGLIVASYDFAERIEGKQITDRSGNHHTATLYGGSWILNDREASL